MSGEQVTFRRAFRDTREPVLGGVAAGLATHLGLPVLWVRAAFVCAAMLGGLGVAFYAALWALLPAAPDWGPEAPGLESARRSGKRPGRRGRLGDAGPAIVLGVLAVGVILTLQAIFGAGGTWWPLGLGLAGVSLLWRQADEAQRERWLDSTGALDPVRAVFGGGGWAAYARVGAGVALIGGALVVFALNAGDFTVAWDVFGAGLLGIAGLAIVIGPWIYRLATDLTAERAERVRSQERADVAAHLHDSVLQTLALIQRNAADAPTVSRLARAQERDLRSWLYDAAPAAGSTVVGALRTLAATIEDDHGVTVDVVSVGDCPMVEGLDPIISAAREAVTNAAKHAGTGRVDVYAEVGDSAVEIFVRDRGQGFDPSAIPDDRHGLRHSIVDRITRHGGTAEVRTEPGSGTEIRLRLPRSTFAQEATDE